MQQMLINLVSNAIKFCNGKDITVKAGTYQSVDKDGDHSSRLVVEVTDQGNGISKEKQATLFK